MKNDHLLLAGAFLLLLISVWIAYPGPLPSVSGAKMKDFSPQWTPYSLKSRAYYKVIVERGVVPGTQVKEEAVQKDERGDILVVGIAEIDGKRSAIIHVQRSRRGERDVVVGEGEEVDGWKVLAIKESSVVLGRAGEKREITIFSPQGSKRRESLVYKRQEEPKRVSRTRRIGRGDVKGRYPVRVPRLPLSLKRGGRPGREIKRR